MQVYCQRCNVLNDVPMYVLYPTEAEIVCVQCGTVIFRGYLGQQVMASSDSSGFTANLPAFPSLTRVPPQVGDLNDYADMAKQSRRKSKLTKKTQKRDKRVRRHIKVIYKGKFGENANPSGHASIVRKPKKAL